MSYVYQRSEPGLWTVGFYTTAGKFIAESDHGGPATAALQCAWLNGQLNTAGRVLTCVFCGQEYPQDTPASGAQVLVDHIRTCPAHPMRDTQRRLDRDDLDREDDAAVAP